MSPFPHAFAPADAAAPLPRLHHRPGPSIWFRHACQLVPVGLCIAVAAVALSRSVPPTNVLAAAFDAVCLVNLALLAHGAMHSVLGFVLTLLPRRFGPRPFELAAAAPSGRARTAVLIPIRNEDPIQVAARVSVMRRSFGAVTGPTLAGQIDLFVLSDTPALADAEAEQAALAALPRHGITVHYRRRADNRRRKAGNVLDWCARWGGGYEFMIVLDGDSLITGEAVARMVGLMEAHPRVALLQTMCWPVGHASLFARLLQHGSRLYSSLSVRGLAFWQGPHGSWWGHNAILRTADFARYCALPDLPGGPPLGGEILCHDTVEAAMLVRAGREVWLATDIEGSYEEVPTNLIDFLVRERRWCQGNLQHAGVLARADGLAVASWLHIAGGFLHYAAAPLVPVLVGISLWGPLHLSGSHANPAAAAGWAWLLGAVTLGLVYVPRALAAIVILCSPGALARYGGIIGLAGSFLAEQAFALLLGPPVLLFVLIFLARTLGGSPVQWVAQNRADRVLSWAEAWRRLGPSSMLAACVVSAIAWGSGESWVAWAFVPGLVGAVPFAVLTARASWGRAAGRLRLFVTPDETDPTPELAAVLASQHSPGDRGGLAPLPEYWRRRIVSPAGFRRADATESG